MNYENIIFYTSNRIGCLVLNRVGKLNALNHNFLSEIYQLLKNLDYNDIDCLIIKSNSEKAFSVGADIVEMSNMKGEDAANYSLFGNQVFDFLENLPIPTVAVINGYALGGGLELAIACDFIITSERGKFGLPEVGLGIIPGFGGIKRLYAKVGENSTKRIIFSGEIIDYLEAKKLGIADLFFPFKEIDEKTREFICTILSNSSFALSNAKKCIQYMKNKENEINNYNSRLFEECFNNIDSINRMKSFKK